MAERIVFEGELDLEHLNLIKAHSAREMYVEELAQIAERDERIVITGAAGGIGRSTAAALAELGADVALVDINLERTLQNAEEINKRFGTHCIALRCDVSDPNSVSTMMAEVLRAYGEVRTTTAICRWKAGTACSASTSPA